MPDHVDVRIPISYPLEYLPLRGSVPRTVQVGEFLDVKVPVIGARDAPVRIEASNDYLYDRYEFEGALYGPVHAIHYLRPGQNDRNIEGTFRNEETSIRALFGADSTERIDALSKRGRIARPTAISRVVSDGRDKVVGETTAAASGLLVRDGRVLRKAPPPVFTIFTEMETVWDCRLDDGHALGKGYAFSVDRMQDLVAFQRRVEGRGGIVVAMQNFRIGKLDWDMAEQREAPGNAFHAASKVLSVMGGLMDRIDHKVIRLAADLSEARGGLFPRVAPDANAIHATLLKMADLVPRKDHLNLMRNIANALDAIETSRDFILHRLDEDDLAAIDGFVP